jgi:hypothetical protein
MLLHELRARNNNLWNARIHPNSFPAHLLQLTELMFERFEEKMTCGYLGAQFVILVAQELSDICQCLFLFNSLLLLQVLGKLWGLFRL